MGWARYFFLVITVLSSLACPLFGQWDIKTVVSDGDVGWGTSITLSSNGNPHISYYDRTTETIKYAVWDEIGWNIQTVASAGVWGSHSPRYTTSLVLDSSDTPKIAYTTNDSIYYASWSGADWETVYVDRGDYACLQLDREGKPSISYGSRPVADQVLKYAYWDGVSWNTQIIDSNPGVGYDSSYKLNLQGYAYISYRDGRNQQLKLAKYTGSSWEIEVVDTDGDVGMKNSLAILDNNNPQIVYRDNDYPGLKYASWNGENWDTQMIATGSVGTQNNEILVDSEGHAHVAYYDASNWKQQSLNYATNTDTGWDITVVDPGQVAGWDISIVLDQWNNPWISYYEYSTGDLRLAHFIPEPATLSLLALGGLGLIRRRKK